jgi:HD-like signal output (HDOD) protein
MSKVSAYTQNITLPTMPEVAHQLTQSLNDEDAPLSTVRDEIAKDPAPCTLSAHS